MFVEVLNISLLFALKTSVVPNFGLVVAALIETGE